VKSSKDLYKYKETSCYKLVFLFVFWNLIGTEGQEKVVTQYPEKP